MSANAAWSDAPDTWAEWAPEFRRLLWDSREELRGAVLVQALKALRDLIETERRAIPGEDGADRRPLIERIDALPPDVADALLEEEIDRVTDYLDAMWAARMKLKEEVAA